MLDGEEIPMFGDGSTSRDYTYIEDIVSGIKKSINYVEEKNNVYEIINLGNSSPVTLKEMINTIGEALEITPNIKELGMQPGDVDRTYADISKAKELLGYEPKTTFWDDFFIAEHFGEKAIRDTYNRAIKEWASDKVYATELVMVLNWKIWMFHDLGNEELARLYNELWEKAEKVVTETLKGDDLQYFYRVTD
jgi:dTDP-D-glucose 4,6-dehydratase